MNVVDATESEQHQACPHRGHEATMCASLRAAASTFTQGHLTHRECQRMHGRA